jgi:hypothetical protein
LQLKKVPSTTYCDPAKPEPQVKLICPPCNILILLLIWHVTHNKNQVKAGEDGCLKVDVVTGAGQVIIPATHSQGAFVSLSEEPALNMQHQQQQF